MTISECSEKLRELSENYSGQKISLDEYRTNRKYLLDDLDRSLNGQNIDVLKDNEVSDQSKKRCEAEDDNVAKIDEIFDISKDTH